MSAAWSPRSTTRPPSITTLSSTKRQSEPVHVMHVLTDDGLEGMCTVGDVRYRVMTERELAQLRELVIGEDASERERLDAKLHRASRFAFTRPGWAGAFDNCLWDIAGKAACRWRT